MSIMQNKGHAARIAFDPADRTFVRHIADINDVIGFHADKADEPQEAFYEAVEDYVTTCAGVAKRRSEPTQAR